MGTDAGAPTAMSPSDLEFHTACARMMAFSEPEVVADPYSTIYSVFHDAGPVRFLDFAGAWVISGYEEASAILRDARAGSGVHALKIAPVPVEYRVTYAEAFDIITASMSFMDPPDHTRVRRAVQAAFTPRAIEEMRPFVRRTINEQLDGVLGGTFDFYQEVALPYPAAVICDMLGVPPEDRSKFMQWNEPITAFLGQQAATDEVLAALRDEMVDCEQYFRGLVDVSRGTPGLFGRLIAQHDDDRLSWPELVANALFLVTAGHETTASLMSTGLYGLLRNPGQFSLLRQNRELLPNAVEEFLRYDAPLHLDFRSMLAPMEFGDALLDEGHMVIFSLAAANHDPRVHQRADALDVTRANPQHLAFAQGNHFCLGAALARLEAQEGFAAVLDRMPDVALSETPAYRPNPMFRSVESLMVTA
ncbi:MAG: hypothetical protein QOF53_2906 [Nocardioidaceae bacterium]|jgi:cytochrome P450|nr:hypothetical protein [Nocardioidaceae bacterium]